MIGGVLFDRARVRDAGRGLRGRHTAPCRHDHVAAAGQDDASGGAGTAGGFISTQKQEPPPEGDVPTRMPEHTLEAETRHVPPSGLDRGLWSLADGAKTAYFTVT